MCQYVSCIDESQLGEGAFVRARRYIPYVSTARHSLEHLPICVSTCVRGCLTILHPVPWVLGRRLNLAGLSSRLCEYLSMYRYRIYVSPWDMARCVQHGRPVCCMHESFCGQPVVTLLRRDRNRAPCWPCVTTGFRYIATVASTSTNNSFRREPFLRWAQSSKMQLQTGQAASTAHAYQILVAAL